MLTLLLALTLQAPATETVSAPAPLYRSVDVDRDGRLDLFALTAEAGILVLGNEGAGQLTDRTAALGLDRLPPIERARWRDVDADGWSDLVVLTRAGQIELLRSERGGNFSRETLFAGSQAERAVDWQWVSLDDDARLDLLVQTRAAAHVLLAEEGGTFRPAGSVALDSAPVRSGTGPVAFEDLTANEVVPSTAPETSSDRRVLAGGGALDRAGPDRGAPDAARTPRETVTITKRTRTPPGVVQQGSPTCPIALHDLASGSCVNASSMPLLGALYPLGIELFIDPGGRVGLGTTSPTHGRLEVTPDAAGDGIYVDTDVPGGTAIEAISSSDSDGFGMLAEANSPVGRGVRSINQATSGNAIALEGVTRSTTGWAVHGIATSTTGTAIGVRAQSDAADGAAVYAEATGGGTSIGVVGETQSADPGAAGVLGVVDGSAGGAAGVWGLTDSDEGYGVRAENTTATNLNAIPIASYGHCSNPKGIGVFGRTTSAGFPTSEGGVGAEGFAHTGGVGVAGISHGNDLFAGTFPVGIVSEGIGVIGWDFAPTGTTFGVLGQTQSADANSAGVYGYGSRNGVRGVQSGAAGAGVHGDSMSSSAQVSGVLGTVDSLSTGGFAAGVRGEIVEVGTGNGIGVYGKHAGAAFGVYGECDDGWGVYGISANGIAVQSEGDMVVNGSFDVVGGPKNFVHPHPTDPSKEVRFTCLEGNESGTFFRGSARLAGGRATIDVPEEFRLVSEADGLTVQLTPVGSAAQLYVESQDLRTIVVRGAPDVQFHYFCNGIRAGFADHEAIVENEHFVPTFADQPFGRGFHPSVQETLERTGVLTPGGLPNLATAERLGWSLREAGSDQGALIDTAVESAKTPVIRIMTPNGPGSRANSARAESRSDAE